MDKVHHEKTVIVVIDHPFRISPVLKQAARIRKNTVVLSTGDSTEATGNPAMFRAVDAIGGETFCRQ